MILIDLMADTPLFYRPPAAFDNKGTHITKKGGKVGRSVCLYLPLFLFLFTLAIATHSPFSSHPIHSKLTDDSCCPHRNS